MNSSYTHNVSHKCVPLVAIMGLLCPEILDVSLSPSGREGGGEDVGIASG